MKRGTDPVILSRFFFCFTQKMKERSLLFEDFFLFEKNPSFWINEQLLPVNDMPLHVRY